MPHQIPVGQGLFALVDDADYAEVSKYRWYVSTVRKRKYAFTSEYLGSKNGKKSYNHFEMHRFIMGDAGPGLMVDHISRDTLDNRRCNLRWATRSQNNANSGPRKGRKFKGVYYVNKRPSCRPAAYIMVNKKMKYLGMHDTEEQAARAYDAAARSHYGEFAGLNFPAESTRN